MLWANFEGCDAMLLADRYVLQKLRGAPGRSILGCLMQRKRMRYER